MTPRMNWKYSQFWHLRFDIQNRRIKGPSHMLEFFRIAMTEKYGNAIMDGWTLIGS